MPKQLISKPPNLTFAKSSMSTSPATAAMPALPSLFLTFKFKDEYCFLKQDDEQTMNFWKYDLICNKNDWYAYD